MKPIYVIKVSLMLLLMSCTKINKDKGDYKDLSDSQINELKKTRLEIQLLEAKDTFLRGDTAEYYFVLKNLGPEKFTLSELLIDCSCIRPSLDSTIGVNFVDTIKIEFLTKNYSGSFNKHAVLKGNSFQKFHKLQFSGYIDERP